MKRAASIWPIISCSAGLALMTYVVLAGWFPTAEKTIFDLFYPLPESWHIFFINITNFGSTAALYSMVAVTLVLGYKKLGWLLLGNGMASYAAAWFLKVWVGRGRPADLWPHVTALEWGKLGNGYPSGHVAVVTAIAATLWPFVAQKYRPWLVILVILVAISRMSLGVHAPFDIVGGFFVGMIISLTAGLFIHSKSLLGKSRYRKKSA